MPLVTSKEILQKAKKQEYGIAAFNANCLEIIPALIHAADEEKAPLMVQISKKFLEYLPPYVIASLVKDMARKSKIPICLHLDHGSSVETAQECLDVGFTSLMYDGSYLPLEQNIEKTKQVVKLASVGDIPVEGEVGQVLLAEDVQDIRGLEDLTEPSDARLFVERTGVSSVAVAVGNVHRMRVKEAKLDFDRIKAIKKAVDVPLVMHGSSGIADKDLQEAIKAGITKVNIATEYNAAFVRGVKEKIQKVPNEIFPMEILIDGMNEVRSIARDRIRMLGCNNKY